MALKDYRNIAAAEFSPGYPLTVLCGDNGQGKTNLLEAIWLLTGSKSFRGAKDTELVRRGADTALLRARVEAGGVERELSFTVGLPGSARPGRLAKLNGADQGRASELAGLFTAVVFAPGHLNLVKGSPEGRRRFIDGALCQLYPGYLDTFKKYLRVMAQKNALLKHYNQTPGAGEMLDVFDEQMAAAGEELTRRRGEYLAALRPLAVKNYEDISRGAEEMALEYQPSFGETGLLEALRAARKADLHCGFCTVGPHREDFSITLNGQAARTDASQGQQRSAVLSLKLAEAARAEQVAGEHPVMLLDDVLSELDERRQAYLLTRMEGRQIFVTSCDAAAFRRTDGAVFCMRGGRLSPAEQEGP